MKLLIKQRDGKHVHRVYVAAKTPVLATYVIRRANEEFPSPITRLFMTDTLIGQGLGE